MRWLSVTLLLPLAGALVIAFLPKSRHTLIRAVALAVSVAAFGMSLGILARFTPGEAGFQLVEREAWIPAIGVDYALGVDGISLFLVLLTTFLWPICVLASWKVERNPKLFMGLLLALETTVLGVFLALDLFLFYVMWEAMLVPMYFLIGYWGYERRIFAAVKFFLYTLLGGLIMLAGILVLAFQARAQFDEGWFDIARLQEIALGSGTQRWLFLAFFVAFAIKVPIFPLHTWLPDAHTEAPTAGSVILAGVLLKLGGYGFLRISLPMFPDAAREAVPWVVALALLGIIYGGVVALMQTDLKRLVAYSSVSHLGFVVLGIFLFTVTGLQGATIHMVNHGLATGGLFLLVGMLSDRLHTREIDRFGGLATAAPVYAGLFLVVALASLGLPGLNGFVGEILVLVSAFGVNKAWAVAAGLGVILAALYLLWAYQRTFHGPISRPENRTMPDVNVREKLILAPIVAGIVLLGVWPQPVLERMEPSLTRVVERVNGLSPGVAVPEGAAPGAGGLLDGGEGR